MSLLLSDLITNYSTYIVFVIILFSTLYLRQRSINSLPPGPTPLPIVGNVLSYGKTPINRMCEWAEKFGDIMTLYQGPFRVSIWINDGQLAIDMFQKQPELFSERNFVPFMTYNMATEGSVVWENGPAWKARRRWMITALRYFGMGKRSLEVKIKTETDIFCQETGNYHSDPFNPQHIVNCAVANITCNIAFGDRYEYSDPEFQELLENLLKFFKQCSLKNIETHIPSIMSLPMFKHKALPAIYLTEFVRNQVKKHKETFDPENIRDITDRLLAEGEMCDKEEKKFFNADVMWTSLLTIFIAGAETTSSTLMWFFIYMATYQEVQDKVRKEIDDVLDGRKPTMADQTSLSYFEATTCEVQRLGNIAGATLPHGNAQECLVKGYKLPKGTIINLNLYRIHTDPKYWDDPMTFDPSRFLIEDGQKVNKPKMFMPFGIGRRACLGESMAKMEIFLFMTNFFQRFKLIIPEGEPLPDLDPLVGLTMSPKPFKMCAIPRE